VGRLLNEIPESPHHQGKTENKRTAPRQQSKLQTKEPKTLKGIREQEALAIAPSSNTLTEAKSRTAQKKEQQSAERAAKKQLRRHGYEEPLLMNQ
jgi:hypothetical protein